VVADAVTRVTTAFPSFATTISAEEFERRKKLPWPNDLPGMIEAREQHPPQPGPAPKRDTRTRHRRNENDDLFGPEFEA
jgi:hypothetical protein